jgi:tripartite-type tricarboxylate transporter receptor subunit TctC
MRKPMTMFVVLGALAATLAPAMAQDWPQKTIRIIVGFGAGGGTDIVSRILAQTMQEKLGQPVVVENRPGAGGTIGAEAVARADKDGYTLGMMTNGHVIAATLAKSMRYDTLTAFDTVGLVATAGLAIVTRPSFAPNTVKDLVEAAKQNPGKITYASVGFGGTQHFAGEMFRQISGVDILHVPYRGSPDAIMAVLGNQVDVMFDTVSAVLGQVQSGELKVLAVTGKGRFPALPNVPAAAESGVLPGYDVTTWYGMIAPRGLPVPVLEKLNKVLNETIADPVVRERLTKAGVIARSTSVQEFSKHIEDEYVRWNKVREAAGIPQQ